MHASHSQSGFTLIELLITLSIVGMLVMIGMPALGSMLARSHEQSAESALEASLMHARELAVTRRMQVIVCPSANGRDCASDDDWQHGWLIAADANRDRQPDLDTPALAVFDRMPQGMRIIASRGRPRLIFRPDGSASGTNAQLTVCHAGDKHNGRAVVVANSGRVRTTTAQSDRLGMCLAGLR